MTNFTEEFIKGAKIKSSGNPVEVDEIILSYASRLREEIKPIINRIRIRLSFEERDQIIEEELQRLQSLLPPNQGELNKKS